MIDILRAGNLPDLDMDRVVAFSRLRRFPGFSKKELTAILRADLDNWLNSDGGQGRVVFDDKGHVSALGCLVPMEWDSRHFGMSMSRLHLAISPELDMLRCRELVEKLLNEVSLRSGDHVSAEVDIDDYTSLNTLIRLGFEVLDLRRTYCTNRMRDDIDFVRMSSRTRHYRPDDHQAVMALVAQTVFPSRFSRDPSIDQSLVSAMYSRWFEELLSSHGQIANAIVYERAGEVIACGAIGEKSYSYAGVQESLRTGSLYAGRADSVGAYVPVLYRLIVEALASHGLVETTVSLNNVTVCRVLEGFRSYKSAVASYSLRLIMP